MKNRKILRVDVYQSVYLDNRPHKSFAPNPVGVNNQPPLDITRTDDGIKIESPSDCIEVFKTNISFIKYEKEKVSSVEQESVPKSEQNKKTK